MAETHKTERTGFDILEQYLKKHNRVISKSNLKQYDIIVDGKYCELKAKRKSFDGFDFLYISENQKLGIDSGEMASLFLVCNTDNPDLAEIYEIPAEVLKSIKPKSEVKYYYDKGMLSDQIGKWRK